MYRRSLQILFLILLIPCFSYTQQNGIELTGLTIYEEEDLIKKLRLWQYNTGAIDTRVVVNRINQFYKKQGYALVKIYIVKRENKKLKLFVDEGRLNKILFLKTDAINLMWLRYQFDLKGRVFNVKQMRINMKYLREDKGYKNAFYKLKPVKSYNKSVFQLDRKFKIPILGETLLPFFNEIGARYNLEITLSKRPLITKLDKNKKSDTTKKKQKRDIKSYSNFDYRLNVHYYKGFIPKIRYYHLNLVTEGDGYVAGFSMGIMYGIDRKFGQWPRWTFFQFEQTYLFTPTLRDYFTPYIRNNFYYSRSSRSDLGILIYDYMKINTLFAPGITLLSRLKLYTGIGVEIMRFNNSKNDLNHIPYTNIERRIDIYNYFEIGLLLDIVPIHLGDPLKKNIAIIFDVYYLDVTFQEFKILMNFSFETEGGSIFKFLLQYRNIWENPPFYHEASVTNSAFKGFQGLSYYSRGVLSVSNEYLMSIYRDYIYLGAFFDNTVFQGSGYDLSGIHYGIIGGPTMRFLIFDQIEVYFYLGWDYLFARRESQMNFTFNLFKKW